MCGRSALGGDMIDGMEGVVMCGEREWLWSAGESHGRLPGRNASAGPARGGQDVRMSAAP